MSNRDPRWYAPILMNKSTHGKSSLCEAFLRSCNRAFDMEALITSEYGEKILEVREPMFISDNPADERVIQYWRDRGLRKECMWGGPQDWNQWEIFTPLSALEPQNANRKYPLVFALHGGSAGPDDGATIYYTECSCYAQKAAEKEFILALMDDHDDDGIMRMYDYLVKNYPVDLSRVYLTGYSAGSNRSIHTASLHPELFAGMVIGAGMPFDLEYDPDRFEVMKRYKMPFVAVGCLNDKGNHTPFYSSNPIENPLPDFVARHFTAEGKIRWINTFFDVNHIPFYSLEENRDYVNERGTPEEKRIGIRAHRSYTYEWGGIKHLCLEYTDDDGVDSVRYVFIDRLPHFEPPDLMDIGWAFLERFSRDPSSHELICSGPLQRSE